MTKRNEKTGSSKSILLVIAGLFGLSLIVWFMLRGADVALMNPKGMVAIEQHRLLVYVTAVLLLIGIPSLLFFYYFAWRYRETNSRAVYSPNERHGLKLEVLIWTVPIIFALMVSVLLWPATYRLQPKNTLASSKPTMTIQVVALQWKWLFIYPEQGIATVNYVQIPVDTPVRFELTADEAPMSSFWVPHLGGQLYAMTGHVNPLNLMADETGDYPGSSAEINGTGFAGMKFTVRASSQVDYDTWVQSVRQSGMQLDEVQYSKLVEPSKNNPAAVYARVNQDLYDTILVKYSGSHQHGSGSDEHKTEHR